MISFVIALILAVPNVSQRAPGMRVVDFGAYPNDGVDDTAAIQAAIDATPDGGTLSFADGKFDVTADAITITKSITIRGEGTFYTSDTSAYGDTAYLTDTEEGTIIQSDSPTGIIFDFDDTAVTPVPQFRVVLDNIAFKGLTGVSDTLTCTRFRSIHTRAKLRDVTYINCYRGLDAEVLQDSVLDAVAAHGCHTGLLLGENSNSNVITGYDAHGCDYGIINLDNTSNNFIGGTIQGSAVYGFWGLGASHATLLGVYFESSAVGAKAVSLDYGGGKGELVYTANTGTDRLTFSEAHGRTVGDAVTLRNYGGGLPAPLAAGTYYVQATPSSTALTLSLTKFGALIDLTTAGSGRNFLSAGTNGGSNTLSNCYFATTGDAVDVWTTGNSLDMTNATYALTLKSGTSGNVVRSSSSFTYTDEGAGNVLSAWGVNGETRTFSPSASAEGGQYLGLYGWYNLLYVRDTADWFGIELRDDVGYVRFLDVVNNVSMMDYHPNATPASRYTEVPALLKLVTGLQTDTITNYSGSSVTVKNAVFTGASTAASSLAIAQITADDGGSVYLTLDNAGDTASLHAASVVLTGAVTGATNLRRVIGSGRPALVSPAGTAGYETLETVAVGNLLTHDGDALEIEAVFQGANNANVKNVRIQLDGTTLETYGVSAANSTQHYVMRLVRTASTTGRLALHDFWYNSGAFIPGVAAAFNKTWANSLNLTFDVHTPTATTDETFEYFNVTYVPAL